VDISVLGKDSIKLKGKNVTFVVNPTKGMPKIAADAVIILDGASDLDLERVTESRITIEGPGGYEIGGAKIYGTQTPVGTLYKISLDNVSILLGPAADVEKEGFNVCQVAIVNTSNNFNESYVTAMEPKIVVLCGDKKVESAKALGAEKTSLVSKISVTKDKLPEKMEIVVLG
jgi:hypothetical protein